MFDKWSEELDAGVETVAARMKMKLGPQRSQELMR